MTQNMTPAAEAPPLTFGPGAAQNMSHELAQAVLWEVWKASPERFGNFVKKAMIRLWAAGAASSSNGQRSG